MLRAFAVSRIVIVSCALCAVGDATAAARASSDNLVLVSWKLEHDGWRFSLWSGTPAMYAHMSHRALEEFAAETAGPHQDESSFYTAEGIIRMFPIYHGARIYWLGFPRFRSYWANLTGYPPPDVIAQVRRAADASGVKLLMTRVGH